MPRRVNGAGEAFPPGGKRPVGRTMYRPSCRKPHVLERFAISRGPRRLWTEVASSGEPHQTTRSARRPSAPMAAPSSVSELSAPEVLPATGGARRHLFVEGSISATHASPACCRQYFSTSTTGGRRLARNSCWAQDGRRKSLLAPPKSRLPIPMYGQIIWAALSALAKSPSPQWAPLTSVAHTAQPCCWHLTRSD